MIDGAQGTAMAAILRRVVEDPEQELGAIAGGDVGELPSIGLRVPPPLNS
jgi:hypothetical protein